MQVIKLQSSDNEIFETDIAVAKCSGTIRKLMNRRDIIRFVENLHCCLIIM